MARSCSLLPVLLGRDWWDVWSYPCRLTDQHFGLCLAPGDHLKGEAGVSEVKIDEKKFLISLDVNQFAPNEISVKTVGNCVEITGEHAEKPDQHGFISRKFVRRYVLPKDVEPETVTSSLGTEGLLKIEAPKKPSEQCAPAVRDVPIATQEAPAAAASTPVVPEPATPAPDAQTEPTKPVEQTPPQETPEAEKPAQGEEPQPAAAPAE